MKVMEWFSLTTITLTITMVRATTWVHSIVPIRFIDIKLIDTFFDRLVGVVDDAPNSKRNFSMVASAVAITDELLLSSNNAFIKLSQRQNKIKDIKVAFLFKRKLSEKGKLVSYIPLYNAITCARQVISPFLNQTAPSDMRHGMHRPIHDLMVMRVEEKINFLKPIPQSEKSFDRCLIPKYSDGKEPPKYICAFGPVQTDLAKPEDVFEADIKFASLGHDTDAHINNSLILHAAYFEEDPFTDCDEWMPREWGIFICLKNTKNYVGIASGGMLFSGDKLFGVGSFAIFKGKESILVFTDVRPYWDLLHRTCTESDQNLIIPPN